MDRASGLFRRAAYRGCTTGLAVWLPIALLAWGCVTHSATIVPETSTPPPHRVVLIRPCQDRSGFSGRDLGAETTRALTKKIKAT